MSWTKWIAVVAMLSANIASFNCSSSLRSRPPAVTPPDKPEGVSVAEAVASDSEVTPETYCADVARLMSEKCEALNIAPEDQDEKLCVEGIRRALYDRTEDAAKLQTRSVVACATIVTQRWNALPKLVPVG